MRDAADSHRPSTSHLGALVLVALAAMLAVLAYKGTRMLEWRPTDLAGIALNYSRHGFDFVRPQVLWGGAGPGYVETECPLLPFGIALLYVPFGVHDWVALILPVLFGLALPVVIYVFTSHVFTRAEGLVAGLLVATTPTWLDMSTSVWPDPPPIVFATLGLYWLVRWVEDGARRRFVAAAAAIAVAILLKLTSLYLWLPVAFLFWVKYGRRWWRAPGTWLFAALVLVPSLVWYVHAHDLFLQYHNTFGIVGGGYSKFGTAAILTDPRFYARTFLRFALFHATPVALLLVGAGGLRRANRRVEYVVPIWLGSVIFYLLVAAKGVDIGHFQYMLPIVPPTAMLAGLGAVSLFRWLVASARTAGVSSRWLAATAALLMVVNAAAANVLYQSRRTSIRFESRQKMITGMALARVTQPNDLVVVVDADMDRVTPDRSMTPPEVFYFSDRHGWYRSMAWLGPETMEELRGEGARYLAVSANDADLFRRDHADMYRGYATRYATIQDDAEGIIYRLTDGAGGATRLEQ